MTLEHKRKAQLANDLRFYPHGKWWECAECGNMVQEDKAILVGYKIYCRACWNNIRKENANDT